MGRTVQYHRAALRRHDPGLWLAAGLVGLSLLALAAILSVLAQQALQAFAPTPVAQLRWRGDGGEQQLLAAVVTQDAHALVVRGSEWQRRGAEYRRIARADLRQIDWPADARSLRLRDGREIYLRGDSAAQAPDGSRLAAAEIVEDVASNRLGRTEATGLMLRRAWDFVSGAAQGGGVFPALVGTVVLVLLMSVLVMPLGVLLALWLHEYAGSGRGARILRAAMANLAGVPAVIYGLFGLVLFVNDIGGGLDALLQSATPRWGGGGLLWSALTLALLTLPVVVIATEEGLARVPASLRHGALALGATRAEMLWRVVLPVARPALLTALILAVARAAGEVAPLMLVGAVKYAPALPLDGEFPYLHLSRQFMHLGQSVYDLALAGGDVPRDMAQAHAAALLLLVVVVGLNAAAIVARNRLRERARELAV
ncbi:MAG: phosphate ABC transporter, permease protein PstA [Lysobacterales bacterium 69-70]|nr:phosphate ABC transporter permease PstA [Xanthomonadaceae bacterium]ODU36149.1 MAG: phosphate ABC transporter, permease protein PstA [Xanthomonadaceae bacterium SCN 69-320]ODV17585.1 MAG: phosphate ABC transporter, permease protein PstA [Xanthomonadaceae bacterium SCN 69-25]OJY99392.1 MAG: phosphate ABC transporter, permease protein PstA [Xanthomonadales bacterium 69-70]